MKIYKMNSSIYKVFNSLSGEYVVDEECDDNAKDLIAYWLGDYSHYNNETLKAAWIALWRKIML